MKLLRKAGSTSNILQIFLQDTSSSVGAGLTGVSFGASGIKAFYHRDTDTTATSISLVTMTLGTYTSGGFAVIDGTNMPGWYQFCPPNAALASGAANVGFHLKGVANMADLPIEAQLVGYDTDDSIRLGLTALPNVVSGNSGAIPTVGTGTAQISVSSGQVILQTGTGTGQLSFTSGVVSANVTQLNADATSAANIAKTTRAIARGTVGNSSTTTSIITSAFAPASVAVDQFKGRIVTFDADTTTTALRGQATDITASTIAGGTPVLTVTALTNAPANGDTFSVT